MAKARWLQFLGIPLKNFPKKGGIYMVPYVVRIILIKALYEPMMFICSDTRIVRR